MFRLFSKEFILALIFILVIVGSGLDLLTDLAHGVKTAHLYLEGIILLIAILALSWLLLEIKRQTRKISNLKSQLEEIRNLPSPMNEQIIDVRKRLSLVIAEQFVDWNLTKSEQEIGQYLLKGLSLKEISMLRGTAEKTIRQQASSIYQKAGVSGRHAFSAWFIEDFL